MNNTNLAFKEVRNKENELKKFMVSVMADALSLKGFLECNDMSKFSVELGYSFDKTEIEQLNKVRDNIKKMVNTQIAKGMERVIKMGIEDLCNGTCW